MKHTKISSMEEWIEMPALITLSQNLRQMAINEGLEIDDTFRNLNGINGSLVILTELLREIVVKKQDLHNYLPTW